jgi:cystathionine beta-synthase
VAALRVARKLGPDGLVVVLAPDSGRAYLSKYFDDGWLRRAGFPAPPVPGPLVGDLRVEPPVVVPVAARVRDLPGRDHTTGIALLVLPRAKWSSSGTPGGLAPGDIASVVSLDGVAGVDPDAPLAGFTGPVLPTIGAGEPSAEALSRTPADAAWLAVLTDGRVTGVIFRAALA